MYLIITTLAAIITTVVWYIKTPDDKYKLGTLCLMYWGASLMWLVDNVMTYLMEGGEFFDTSADAALLGISVVLLGLIIWLVTLLIKDPKKIFGRILKN